MSKIKGKKPTDGVEQLILDDDDFTQQLIDALNKTQGHRVAFNLSSDMTSAHVKRWVSTGSTQLDYVISNRRNGGVPEGRIIEVFGPPSTGKSHIGYELAKSTQRAGGVCVYIDTENALSLEKLQEVGINVAGKFVFVESHCTEEVFSIIESTIEKAKLLKKDVPVTVIWDSVAATSPKAEIEGDYDQTTVGLQARTLSKGFRKLTGVVAENNVTLVCLNQTRTKIGVLHGDPTTTSGGLALPFHASVRVQLYGGQPIKSAKDPDIIIGIRTACKIIKNKVAMPWRKCEFNILFGRGLNEDEQMFDVLRETGKADYDTPDGKHYHYLMEGVGAWKTFKVLDVSMNILHEKKFYKVDFGEVRKDPVLGPHVENMIEAVMVKDPSDFVPEVDVTATDEDAA